MKNQFLAAAFSLAFVAGAARAQSEVSALSAVSALPLASVAAGASTASAALAIPAVLSAGGAVFVVRSAEVSARGTIYGLERVSDGARVGVEIAGRGALTASVVAGAMVTVSVIGTGVVLSAAGEAIAFLPNALGRALLHNEQLTF